MRVNLRSLTICHSERSEESQVSPRRQRRRFLARLGMTMILAATANAQEFANVEYLCADWGPAMKLSGKTHEPPVFSDTEEEVYFLKQVGRFTRKKQTVKDPFSGQQHQDTGKGLSIYLCKMKSDGSEKTELRELWKNPAYAISTQSQSTWMDVNEKTKKIALSITFAGSDITGLWTMNLDGSGLKRILTPDRHMAVPGTDQKALQAINRPSWTADGKWIVFEEGMRGVKMRDFNSNRSNIAICDADGHQFRRLLESDGQTLYNHSSVSPNGTTIVYGATSVIEAQRGIWLMNIDGTNQRRIPNPDDKHKAYHSGTYPTWSPDGGRIKFTETIVDAVTGKKLLERRPSLQGDPHKGTTGWPQWGRSGFVGSSVGGILFTDAELKEAKWIGSSKLAESTTHNNIW